jgi:N-acetylmuramoyl-L-alanine amidase
VRTIKKRFFGAVLMVGLMAAALGQSTHSAPMRYAPTRAATASSGVRIDGVDYVPVAELQRRCGLSAAWVQKDEHLLLKNDRWQIELGVDSRESQINGHRLLLGAPCRFSHRVFYISRIDVEKIVGPILLPGYQQSSVPDPRVITIDPGHGGVDNGTTNKRLGLLEKTMAFDVATRLAKLLRADGYKIVMTRETDTKIELPIRAATANAAGSDLFLSIHFNSLEDDTKTNGTEIFTFAPADFRSTDSWSRKTDDSEKEPSPVNKYDHWSSVLGYALQRVMLGSLKTFDRGKKIAHWGVLKPLNCPGVLIESGFLSNPAEARKISTPEYRQQIAEAIASGVRDYATTLELLRKSQSAPAPQRTN